MKILVIGGGGFLGSHVIEQLIKEDSVKEIINYDIAVEGYCADNLFNNSKVKNIIDDNGFVYHGELIQDYLPDVIYNIGALTHVDTSIKQPLDFIYCNETLFCSLLEAIAKYKRDTKIIHISTDEVFGSIEEGSIDNKGNLFINGIKTKEIRFNPSSVYSSSKTAQEMLCEIYKRAYNLDIKIVRFTNLFGKRQHHTKFIPKVIQSIYNNQPISVYGIGDQKRTWLYVTDAVDYLISLLTYSGEEEYFNCSNLNNEVNNLELIDIIAKKMNKSYLINFVPDRLNHDFRYSLITTDINKNSKPKSLLEGLELVISNYFDIVRK